MTRFDVLWDRLQDANRTHAAKGNHYRAIKCEAAWWDWWDRDMERRKRIERELVAEIDTDL